MIRLVCCIKDRQMNISMIVNAVFLGFALAMDAFSVSVADGLNDPSMRKREGFKIALVFGIFQAVMPLTGWFFTHYLVEHFALIRKAVPYIAFILLFYVGINMIREAGKNEVKENVRIGFRTLLLQGIATSIDALSVGFTIADHAFGMALCEVLIIGIVTIIVCIFGVMIGKASASKLAEKAPILGGVILLIIGLKIFITEVF